VVTGSLDGRDAQQRCALPQRGRPVPGRVRVFARDRQP